MSERYEGPLPEDRIGCILAAAIGVPVLILDLARVMGDAGPERNELIDRNPIFLPTLFIVIAVFFISRAVVLRLK